MPKVTDAHMEARRQQILRAACACFSREGVHRTTVRDICREANLSTGAIYSYFASKEQIVDALAEMGRQNTRKFLLKVRTAEEAPAALAQMLAAVVEFFDSAKAQEPARLDLRLWGEGLHSPRIRELFLQAFASVSGLFAQTVRSGQERGEVASELDPESAARVFVALGLGFTVQAAMDPEADLSRCSEVISSLVEGTFTPREATA